MLSYVIAVVGITAVIVGWTFVQSAWRRAFLDADSDPDVLAGRMSCSSCTCSGAGTCQTKKTSEEARGQLSL
jgi:hypothetical protein